MIKAPRIQRRGSQRRSVKPKTRASGNFTDILQTRLRLEARHWLSRLWLEAWQWLARLRLKVRHWLACLRLRARLWLARLQLAKRRWLPRLWKREFLSGKVGAPIIFLSPRVPKRLVNIFGFCVLYHVPGLVIMNVLRISYYELVIIVSRQTAWRCGRATNNICKLGRQFGSFSRAPGCVFPMVGTPALSRSALKPYTHAARRRARSRAAAGNVSPSPSARPSCLMYYIVDIYLILILL